MQKRIRGVSENMFRLIFSLIRTAVFLIAVSAAFLLGGIVFNLDRLGLWKSQVSDQISTHADRYLPEKQAKSVEEWSDRLLSKIPPDSAGSGKVSAAPVVISGTVLSVHDGDTLAMKTGSAKIKVRLFGIDAPELTQEYGSESASFLKGMVLRQNVTAQVHNTDSYGRAVARIYCRGTDVNAEMVREGAAWHCRYFAPGETDLAQAQKEAMNAGRGLWKKPSPVPPWIYRAKQRKASEKH